MDKGVFWGVFWGILAASLVSGLVGALVMLTFAVSARHDVQRAIDHFNHQIASVPHDAYVSRREDPRIIASRRASRVLSDSQKCIAHTVVDARGNTYTQRIRNGRPVACHGRLADRPFSL